MLTEFASLQLSREELREIHAALLQKAIVEEEVRRERGQEKVDRSSLLERFEMLLGESEEVLHVLDHAVEDELWEYSWYSFTDEWAWFRAAQDAKKEGGDEKLTELKYQKNFETYIKEIDMREASKKIKASKSLPKES